MPRRVYQVYEVFLLLREDSGDAGRSMEKYREIADDSIVIPRSCSSGRESRYLIFPANLGEMMPLAARSASVREVFPWSCQGVSRFPGAYGRMEKEDLQRGLRRISWQMVSAYTDQTSS